MPYYYDVNRALTTNGSAGTESTHFRVVTVANQESARITALYATARFATAGGGQMRLKTNTGAAATGGTAQTPGVKNSRGSVAAQTTWFNDATAITAGATLVTRLTVGFAQTGGMGGWVATEPSSAFAMMPNAASPVDIELTSIAASASVTFDATAEFAEGA